MKSTVSPPNRLMLTPIHPHWHQNSQIKPWITGQKFKAKLVVSDLSTGQLNPSMKIYHLIGSLHISNLLPSKVSARTVQARLIVNEALTNQLAELDDILVLLTPKPN